MVLAFQKHLTSGEIRLGRLYYPADNLELLPFEEGRRDVEFHVSYQIEPPRLFRCIHLGGEHPRATINRGWADIVRDKGLMVGDRLEFHVENNEPVRYWIEVYRNNNGIWTLIP